MAQKCSVCTHPMIDAINLLIVNETTSIRDIAQQFGLSKDAIYRHRKEHLPEAMLKSKEAAEVSRADELIEQVKTLQEEAQHVLQEAKAGKDHELVLKAVDRTLKTLDLQAKLLGLLHEQNTTVILHNPQWITLRSVIMRALAEFPKAKMRLVEELKNVGS